MPTFVKRVAALDAAPAPAFLRERAALAVIRHPGVVELVDSSLEADGTGVLLTRRVDGPTVRALLGDGPLDLRRATGLMADLLEALAAVHAAGFVHGDLKPENVVAGVRPVLVDFGLALPAGSRWPDDGAGTPAYMAPEQVRREEVDARTDLYAAATMLYELLTGAPPFDGASAGEIRRRQLASRPVPLAVVLGDGAIPDALADAVLRGLAKSPAERPSSALELARLIAAATT